jgi:hypothetical protein
VFFSSSRVSSSRLAACSANFSPSLQSP